MFRALFAAILLLNVGLLQACGGGSSSPAQNTGDSPTNPVVSPTGNSAPVISGTVPMGKENSSFQFRPDISDADGDALTLSVSNVPSWLNFDATTGTLAGTPGVDQIGTYSDIVLVASDGTTDTRFTFTLTIQFDELEQALRTGDHAYVTSEGQLIQGILASIETNVNRYRSVKNELFELEPDGTASSVSLTQVSWDPTHDAALLTSRFGSNEAILISNAVSNRSYVVQERALAIVGENQFSRYAVFGSNPMRNAQREPDSVSDDMHALLENVINWLPNHADSPPSVVNVVLTQLDESFYFPDQSAARTWLDATYADRVDYNDSLSCNGNQLSSCVTASTDLLVVSSYLAEGQNASAIAAEVERAMQSGVAVAYFHHDGAQNALSEHLLALFDVDFHGDNYWRKLSLENYDASAATSTLPAEIESTKALVTHFREQSFSANLADCADKSCPNDSPYYDEFIGPVETLQGQLRDMDIQGVRLFDTSDYRFQKLLVLLGDFYRNGVSFPMDKAITAKTLFLRSLYADHTVYYNRSVNPAQRNMGNFSRSNFSHIAPAVRSVSLVAKTPFRSTGAYALPGVPFTVSRQDTSEVVTRVFINTLRSGATHEFEEFGYTRPKYLQSSEFLLEPGQSLVLTSPHGGPIQIGFDRNDQNVELKFEQVGEHPYWTSANDDALFSAKLERGDFDWAELVTDHFEVHSTLENMRTTLGSPVWESASEIAEAVTTHTHNFPHVLAGFKGPDIEVVPEIHDFAAANGLDIAVADQVKHMNADQAACGYGCSGNPYDAYWSFDPLGHGDLHEMGHGLERSRFRFTGWDSHASTNYYSYYSKFRYFETSGDTDVLAGCQDLPFEALFVAAQDSKNAQDPQNYMRSANLTAWSEATGIFLQLMMRLQADGALLSGWNMLPRLHIIEREFARADDNDGDWLNVREGLGFETLTRTQARRLDNNDWLLIALSHATARDLRDYFLLWGFEYSDVAGDLVKAKNLPRLDPALHVLDANAYCLGLDHPAVPVDGRGIWPQNK